MCCEVASFTAAADSTAVPVNTPLTNRSMLHVNLYYLPKTTHKHSGHVAPQHAPWLHLHLSSATMLNDTFIITSSSISPSVCCSSSCAASMLIADDMSHVYNSNINNRILHALDYMLVHHCHHHRFNVCCLAPRYCHNHKCCWHQQQSSAPVTSFTDTVNRHSFWHKMINVNSTMLRDWSRGWPQ